MVPGQRVVSEAEASLGLGIILEVDQRRVQVSFPATGEIRLYARDTAPLTRIRFAANDTVASVDGWEITISAVEEIDHLLVYQGKDQQGQLHTLVETGLAATIALNRPLDRLLTGQIDSTQRFELRFRTLQHRQQNALNPVWGSCGGRTSIIPHQIYIAQEVANRYAPRVLLADEVGLGKTIEAGMILHRQLLRGLARRVLILVPESLQHQWLVEMRRRFNLAFSIFDEERCLADEESANLQNPFDAEQLVLCTTDFIHQYPQRHKQLLTSEWDLLIVDEAHHLAWEPEAPSAEYQLVAQLTAAIPGVLLLTATPEQLGKQSHFARLRLLDPDRFSSYPDFLAEEKGYQPVADCVDALMNGQSLSKPQQKTLSTLLNEEHINALQCYETSKTDAEKTAAANALIDQLLDYHGTGRILFRNTRQTIKGFPERKLHSYPLPLPAAYQPLYQMPAMGLKNPSQWLCPERLYSSHDNNDATPWTEFDPRVNWLLQLLGKYKQEKILLITAHKDSVLELAEQLRRRQGIHAAVFHEDMSIVERDRSAAYFAADEQGSQLLICSEIGSEGRNFQFAHHLVLFDLPFNPDLLEQRIGRLDRIGQQQTVNIHVPYLLDSPQELMLQWYHQGLNAIEQACPAASSLFTTMQDSLLDSFAQLDDKENFQQLISTSQNLCTELNQQLHDGKDRLLEYNSFRPAIAAALCEHIEREDYSDALQSYMELAFGCFGVDIEDHISRTFILHPSNQLQADVFPGLTEDGMTITYDRQTALSHENIQFLSWEHPLVESTVDMVLTQETGNTNVIAIKTSSIKAGTLLLESIFTLELANTELRRRFPPLFIRTLISHQGKDYSQHLSHQDISKVAIPLDIGVCQNVVRQQVDNIRHILDKSEKSAQSQLPALRNQHQQDLTTPLQNELQRLQTLQAINPSIRPEEINYLQQQIQTATESIQQASLKLDGLRVIVST